jgi:hypothetical protein
MLADPLFTLAMALNVYLTFFRRYSAEQLRALDMKYVVACYGIPFIPAFTYFFLRTSAGVRGYGPAIVRDTPSPPFNTVSLSFAILCLHTSNGIL